MFFEIIPWIISIITLTAMWLAGNKTAKAWWLGLFNQVLWTTMIIHSELWGLLPTVAGLIFIYTRNLVKWTGEQNA